MGNGAPPINEKDVALQKAQAAAAHGNTILQQLGINGTTYGQGGGYTGNCTTDFSGSEETDVYWYHSDHLGSTSFVTGTDGEVNQNIEYFPSGETFVENHLNSYNTPYKFNSKELDDETGYYYYGARYYNPRVSLWLNVDPEFEKNPSWSPYVYTFNNPVIFTDPDGRDPRPIPRYLLGNVKYYMWRYNDLIRQNPHLTESNNKALDYYKNYGNVYAIRFTNVTSPTLSKEGKIWFKQVRLNLQEAIENRLNPNKYSDANSFETRNNGKDFYNFAFQSHVKAYWNNSKEGAIPLYKLNTTDLIKILLTPDLVDLAGSEGRQQAITMTNDLKSYWANHPFTFFKRIMEAWENRKEISELLDKKADRVEEEFVRRLLSPIIPYDKAKAK